MMVQKPLKERIAEDFSPRMVKIVACESGYKQFVGGKVLKSKTNDFGLFQINISWLPTANRLGYDIMTEEGNYDMAKYIYDNYGIGQWSCNKMV